MNKSTPLHNLAGRGAQAGVTLIELLVVVMIVGILAAVAYPSYQDSVRRSNRAEARSVLLEASQFMERSYTMNNCYHRNDAQCTNATANLVLPGALAQSPKQGTAKYAISFSAQAAQSYTLQAVPTGSMAGDTCGTLTLSNTGLKGAGGSVADCWGK